MHFDAIPPAEVISRIGVNGLNRIGQRALRRLWAQRLKHAFGQAYTVFRARYCLTKTRRDHESPRRRDALEAFALDVLSVSRSKAGRLIGGAIEENGRIAYPVPTLPETDSLLRRIGTSLSELQPSEDDILRARLAETIAAVLSARRVRKGLIRVDDALIERVKSMSERITISDAAISSPTAFREWVAHQGSIHLDSRRSRESTLQLILAADVSLAKRHLVWQVVVALWSLGELDVANTYAASVGHGRATRADCEKCRVLLIELQSIQAEVDYWAGMKDDGQKWLYAIKAIPVYRELGLYYQGISQLWFIARCSANPGIWEVYHNVPKTLRPYIEQELNAFLAIHAESRVPQDMAGYVEGICRALSVIDSLMPEEDGSDEE